MGMVFLSPCVQENKLRCVLFFAHFAIPYWRRLFSIARDLSSRYALLHDGVGLTTNLMRMYLGPRSEVCIRVHTRAGYVHPGIMAKPAWLIACFKLYCKQCLLVPQGSVGLLL